MNTEIETNNQNIYAIGRAWDLAKPDPTESDDLGRAWRELGEASQNHLINFVHRANDYLADTEPQDGWNYLGPNGLIAYERLKIGDYMKAVSDTSTVEYRTPITAKRLSDEYAIFIFDGDNSVQIDLKQYRLYSRPEPVTPPVPDDHEIIIDTITGNPWFADTDVYINPFFEHPRTPRDFGNNWEPAEIRKKPKPL